VLLARDWRMEAWYTAAMWRDLEISHVRSDSRSAIVSVAILRWTRTYLMTKAGMLMGAHGVVARSRSVSSDGSM
jgi:hypothetical protein